MLKAIIFDFDGVVTNSEPLHFRAFIMVLAGLSIEITEEQYFADYAGLNDHEIFVRIFRDVGLPPTPEIIRRLNDMKDRTYERIISGGLPLLPGVEAFINRTSQRWPLSICSGARRAEITTILRHAELLDRFPIIVTADDVEASKPDPAGYLLTLDQLRTKMPSLKAEECLVIEDSLYGIQAAKAAGMKVLGVQTHHTAEELHETDASVQDLTHASDELIVGLCKTR